MPVLGFLERGGLAGKPLSGDPIGFPGTPGERVSFCVGSSEGSGSDGGVWSSVTDSNRGESLIDLKLGRLDDCGYGKTVANLKEKIGFSSLVSKRSRFVNSNNQIPRCQVLGCNMDLSSSKEYNKRHKVCELHTKTAKVVVNDLEKRFCQQCSRFHLLAEFDEGKRSCRKRLASHNERRRKHNRDTNSGQFRRLLPTHYDDKFPAPSLLPKTPFIFPEIFSSGTLREVKYRNSTGCRGSKVEEEAIHNCNLHFPTTNEFLFPKPSFPVHSMEKPLPGLQEIESMGGSFYCESSGRYLRTFTNDNPSFFDGSSAIEGFSRPRHSDCALYLLSSQSQESPAQSFSFPSVGPTHRNVDQFSEKILELQASSQASTSGRSTRFSPSGINSVEDDQLGPVLVSDASDAIDFEVQTDGFFQNSDYANDKDGIYQGLHTVDLLQLSSQFQGAKNQMHMQQEKLENEIFFWDPIA